MNTNNNGSILNVFLIREQTYDFIKNDKLEGIQHAWYFTHIINGQLDAYDTLIQYESQVAVFQNQGILKHKSIPVSDNILNIIGAKSGNIIVFKSSTSEVIADFGLDNVAMSFNYFGPTDEQVIVELKF